MSSSPNSETLQMDNPRQVVRALDLLVADLTMNRATHEQIAVGIKNLYSALDRLDDFRAAQRMPDFEDVFRMDRSRLINELIERVLESFSCAGERYVSIVKSERFFPTGITVGQIVEFLVDVEFEMVSKTVIRKERNENSVAGSNASANFVPDPGTPFKDDR